MKVWLSSDPRCNLRCISCRNNHITLGEKELQQVKRSVDLVKGSLKSITGLGMSGNGDPFVSPVIRDFLLNLNCAEYPNLKLYLLTNGQLLNGPRWEQLKGIWSAVASIQVSVDGASKKTYEKIRRGGSFTTLVDNLRFLAELRGRGAIGEFIISFVVNALNFHEMKAFAQMGFDLGCDQVCFSFMSNWGTFSDEEYSEMAVHLPHHQQHQILRDILNDSVFADPRIFLHNLTNLRKPRIMGESMFV
jgi:MoaA/NifB/PqqE/SkfB family radical SAM enzyme